jgi:hypothetical protein
MCGSTEIDGYAFCLGIDSLAACFKAHTELQNLIRSVTYLIRGAIFRTGAITQAISTLGELIDLYHGHEATKLHDKVYALLGMNSEDLRNANLRPDYNISWEELFHRLVKYLLGNEVFVGICSGKEIAIIKSKGCILGRVSLVQYSVSLNGRQGVDIILRDTSEQQGHEEERKAHWTLHPTAQPIQSGDIICLLQGASKPTVIRLRKEYFIVIMIAASPLENGQTESEIQGRELFDRDFLLVWDWKNSRTSQYISKDESALVQKNDWVLEYSKTKVADDLNKVARMWNVVMILDDLQEYEEAEERLPEAISRLETAFEKAHLHLPKRQYGRAPLSWASKSGHEAFVKLLLKKGAIVDSVDNNRGTPLSWAAVNGHEAVVKLLLENGAIVDSVDNNRGTPLLWAAKNGHKAVVKLLLEKGAVVDSVDYMDQTPLSWAAASGHEAVLKLLSGNS